LRNKGISDQGIAPNFHRPQSYLYPISKLKKYQEPYRLNSILIGNANLGLSTHWKFLQAYGCKCGSNNEIKNKEGLRLSGNIQITLSYRAIQKDTLSQP
jgi:hypothetical protein